MFCNEDAENRYGMQVKDVLEQLIIVQHEVTDHDDDHEAAGLKNGNGGSISMVMVSALVAVCGSFSFGSCIGYSAPTQSRIMDELGLSLSEYSVFGSDATIGAMIGAITSGSVADFIGWLSIYFSKGAMALDIGRLCVGYGIRVISYSVPVYIAEITPKSLRGGLATLNQLMIVIGISVTFIIGTLVPWRTLALIGILPCFLLILGLQVIPESPRWLAKAGHEKEFEVALQLLRGKDADISAEIKECIETLQHLPQAKMLDLFERRYLVSVIVGVGLMVFQQFGGINGINFYTGHIFELAGFPSSTGTIILALIQVPFTVFGAILMDIAGRRPLLLLSASGLLISCLMLGTCFYMKLHELSSKLVPVLAITGIVTYISTYSVGMGPVPWVIMSEIFPINVKGKAGSLVALVNWFGSWAVSLTFKYLMSWSSFGKKKLIITSTMKLLELKVMIE